jgi:ELWxxDGT repeat protein
MVKDINSTSQASGYATPYGLTSINGMLLFGAYDGIHGTALWKSDGTEAGTVMLKDINPLDLTNAGGMLFFRGYDETLGTEEDNEAQGIGLWKSDGTEAGTVLIKHMELSCNEPVFLIDANSTLFFSVADEFNGLELWALRPLPTFIELSSFTAASDHRKAVLQWSTESEIDNAGFNIYRAAAPDGPFIKINTSLIPAQGAPTQGGSYSFIDSNVLNRKTYWYKLEDVDARGVATLHGPVSATPRLIYGVK